ncbi:non-ribosomal peptide synthetase [Streptomyces violens]|uniref:non-ribosomal peptide synthetase n=1 Tax=Streptomyces violens TaxID=66377 RepID=UPI001FE19125|nr:non-ribosomal peptide synthetase [Streptomyces violens]
MRVGELIGEQVRRRPDATALIAPDGRIGYAELDRRANSVARRLVREGVRPGDVVLVQAPRGLRLGVAVLAVLRAGGAFCVVDPRYPEDRTRHMWQRSGARIALTTPDQAPAQVPDGLRVLVMDGTEGTDGTGAGIGTADGSGTPDDAFEPVVPRPEDPAYTVFTSGSTGGPKAIAMPHRALDNLIAWTLASTSGRPLRTMMFAPLGFDVFVQEVFTAWCSGGTLHTPADDERADLQRVLDRLVEWEIERLFVPPVALSRLADLACAFGRFPTGLREVAAAGEALRITPGIRTFFERLPGCRLHNHYGPAETHVAVAHTLTGPPRSWPDAPPIGRPVPGFAAHVRAGELWLSGAGLALGYVSEPELTAERFPVAEAEPGGARVRMYRTGDLVARRPDGILEYRGRADDQVKIRGYRVEPAEIEAVLGRHPAVRECAVVPWEPSPGAERQLVAHVVAEPGHEAGQETLRRHLAARLPDHMVPRHLCTAASLPLSPNGKIDRRRLPPPVTAPARTPSTAPAAFSTSHRGGVEGAVAELWSEVLGVPVDPRDASRPFGELGGTSLSAALLVTRLHARFQVRIDIHEFLEKPTIGALTALVTERRPV